MLNATESYMQRPVPGTQRVVMSVQVTDGLKHDLEQMAMDKRMKFAELVRQILSEAIRLHEGAAEK
jgi:Ni,Fe-hydrogenase III large subunit